MTTGTASHPGEAGREFGQTFGSCLTICLCLGVAAFCLSPAVKAQQRVGHVLDLEGEWFLDGRPGQALWKGEEVPASGIIRIPSPGRYDAIVIRYSNNQIVSKRCRNAGECDQPILLPRAIQRQTSLREFIIEKATRIWRGSPVSSSVHAGRSADGELREAIVKMKEGQADLAPVFAAMKKGRYHVRLERRTPEGDKATGELGDQIEVSWDPVTAATVPLPTLKRGLYEVVLLEKRGAEYKPTLTTAWFLAVSPARHQRTVALFQEATRMTTSWRGQVEEGTVKAFHRAFLIHLASQPAQATKY